VRSAPLGLRLVIGLYLLCFAPVAGSVMRAASSGLQDVRTVALQQLHRDIHAATARSGVQRGIWGIIVHSLDRNERLFELNPGTLLVPASAAKLVSAASAAEAVGWDYRFHTDVRATGSFEDGTLLGDLIVAGSGDPSLGGRGGDDITGWVGALRAVGIERIQGRVIGDDDAIEEPRPALAWAWDDIGYATGAIYGALNVFENRMTVTVISGLTEGGPTTLRTESFGAHRALANRTTTGPRGSQPFAWPEQRPGEPFLTIAGSVPAGSRSITLTVSAGNPTVWFANVLRDVLMAGGIEVTGGAYDIDDVVPRPDTASSDLLFTYTSPPLRDLVRPLLKDSINLYGEAFMRLNATPGAFPTNDAALEGLRRRLDDWGIPAEHQQLIDGSGLSRRNTITPEALLSVLRRMHESNDSSPFMTGLPIAGTDGSLAGRMRGTPAAGNVKAKTGTMTNVRSLAGYVTTRDRERLAFVIMVNNFEGNGTAANDAIDSIAVRLAAFTRAR
jgi:serine-type D-Ala-D-Ala carboxypeptidase/endopeptidase (penicillin-binding protein 4)